MAGLKDFRLTQGRIRALVLLRALGAQAHVPARQHSGVAVGRPRRSQKKSNYDI